MQPVVTVLPELDRVRLEDVSAPALRARNLAAMLGEQALGLGLERLERGESARSVARPRLPHANVAVAWPSTRPNPRQGGGARSPRPGPGARARSSRRRARRAGSPRAPVPCDSRYPVKNVKPRSSAPFRSSIRADGTARSVRRGKRHRLRQRDAGRPRLREPVVELPDGVAGRHRQPLSSSSRTSLTPASQIRRISSSERR